MSFFTYFQRLTDCIHKPKTSVFFTFHGMDGTAFRKDDGTKNISRYGRMVNRRGFLGTLTALSAALLPGGRKAVAGTVSPRTAVLCRCFIAGFQFHQGPAILPGLAAGQKLFLKREPANPYDSLAIAIHADCGSKIGYLPRRLNEIPTTLMDNGHSLTAVITGVAHGGPLWKMVEVEIGLG